MNLKVRRRHLVIFARSPRYGVGKRRLAAQMGDIAAWRFQRWALAYLTRTLRAESRWKMWLCVTQADGGLPVRRSRCLRQAKGDLGVRLTRLSHDLPPGEVVIIGNDSPQIKKSDIASAFHHLRRRRTVFGPTPDGGFWLIGLHSSDRAVPPFANVRWSSIHTLTDVQKQISGVPVFLRSLEDADDKESFQRIKASLKGRA